MKDTTISFSNVVSIVLIERVRLSILFSVSFIFGLMIRFYI